MPLLLHPWFLLGLASVPALVAIYFLYHRLRRREVSALFLWRRLGRAAAGRGRLRPQRPPLLFWAELLLLLLLTAAAAELCLRGRHASVPLAVVLDDSFSLQAGGPGDSARARALAALQREARGLGATSVRVIVAGRQPRAGRRAPAAELPLLLRPWQCRSATADLEAALLLARTQAPDARILVLTDHAPRAPVTDPLVKWVAVGRPLDNAGLCNAVRTAATPERDRLLVEVCAYGGGPVTRELTIACAGRELRRERLPLTPGAVRTVTADVPAAGRVRVALDADALDADNACELPPAWRPRLAVQLPAGPRPLRQALEKALRRADVQLVFDAAAPDLILAATNRPAPADGAWLVRFHIPPAAAAAFTGPFILDRASELCDGVELDGVVWCGAPLGGDGLPVIMAGDAPLLTQTELPGGGRLLEVALDVARSTLTQRPAWPILVWNLLHARARALPGFGGTRALCGERVRLRVAGAGERVRLEQPDGGRLELRAPAGGAEAGFIPEMPGLYRAETSAGSYELAVLPGTPEESDLTAACMLTAGGWRNPQALQHGYWSTAALCGLLALAAWAWLAWLVRRAGRAGR